jgi:hypothetical protein
MAYNPYQSGKIYELNGSGLRYVGSTIKDLKERFGDHRTHYKRWKEDRTKYISSFQLFELGYVEIRLLEEYPCDNKKELHARERYWIEQGKCVNMVIPGRTKKEWYEANIETISQREKKWREANKELITQRNKEYHQTHQEALLQRKKKYYQTHQEALLKQQEEYREAHRDQINQKRRLRYESKKVVSGLLHDLISTVVDGSSISETLE